MKVCSLVFAAVCYGICLPHSSTTSAACFTCICTDASIHNHWSKLTHVQSMALIDLNPQHTLCDGIRDIQDIQVEQTVWRIDSSINRSMQWHACTLCLSGRGCKWRRLSLASFALCECASLASACAAASALLYSACNSIQRAVGVSWARAACLFGSRRWRGCIG
jgi:hypothetical protein